MPGSPPTLRDMIQAARDRGLTYQQLAERAVDPETGETASSGLIFDLAKGAVNRVPAAKHLRAVAAALGEPYTIVRRAAIAEWLPAEDEDAEREELLQEARRMNEIAGQLLDRLGEGEQRQAEGA
jgi:transcriptional regulator with XRE-family HTH domain